MRIVNEKTFLLMPVGTVYAKYEPSCFGEVEIKDDNSPMIGEALSWYALTLTPGFETADDSNAYFDILDRMEKGEPSPPVDYDTVTKDGMYDHDQLFAVFDKPDVEALIARLQRALSDGYRP